MKATVTAVEPIPVISSNFTDAEAVAHLRHYLPNASQPLDEVLKRFEARLGTSEEVEVTCPNCGSELKVQLELDV